MFFQNQFNLRRLRVHCYLPMLVGVVLGSLAVTLMAIHWISPLRGLIAGAVATLWLVVGFGFWRIYRRELKKAKFLQLPVLGNARSDVIAKLSELTGTEPRLELIEPNGVEIVVEKLPCEDCWTVLTVEKSVAGIGRYFVMERLYTVARDDQNVACECSGCIVGSHDEVLEVMPFEPLDSQDPELDQAMARNQFADVDDLKVLLYLLNEARINTD